MCIRLLTAPYIQGRGSFCHVTVVSIATFVSARACGAAAVLPAPPQTRSFAVSHSVPGEADIQTHTYTL